MKNFFKALGFAFLAIITYLMANILLGAMFGIIISIQNAAEIRTMDPSLIEAFITGKMGSILSILMVLSALMTLGLLWLYFLGRKVKFAPYVRFTQIELPAMAILAVFGVFFNLLFIGCLYYITELFPVDEAMENYSQLIEGMFSGNFLWVFLAVVVAAPLFEEIMVRGIIFNDFRSTLPTWAALILQALIFALMHMNVIQSSYAFFLGLAVGYIYYRYNSIWAPIIVHLTFNLTSTLLSQFLPGYESYMIILLAVGVIGSGVFGWMLVKRAPEPLPVVRAEAPAKIPAEELSVDSAE